MSEWTLISNASASMTAVGETTALIFDHDTGDIYAAYIDADLNAVVACKRSGSDIWETAIVGVNVLNDAHNSVSIGIDPLGYIHAVWDIHATALNYKVSTSPRSLDFADRIMSGAVSQAVSYARFYRAGGEFYLLFRDGLPSNGDQWIKRWTSTGWVDVAIPLLSGRASSTTDNAYLGSCMGGDDGRLHIVWTHRVGWYNYGVYYAVFDPANGGTWSAIDGSEYAVPITRAAAEPKSLVDVSDGTISNNGLGIALDSQDRPHIVFSRHVNGGPEVFYASCDGDTWSIRQLTDLRLPRLRACPVGPMDGPPRPCDYELQGPFIAYDQSTSVVNVFYGRSVGSAGPAWQRPPSILYQMSSSNGKDWITREIKREVNGLLGEIIRESSGYPVFLAQETVNEAGNLWLWQPVSTALIEPTAKLSISLPCAGSNYIELPDNDAWSCDEWTIAAHIIPEDTKRTMGIIDKGGALGTRELRLLLWGYGPPLAYHPGRVQVLIGGESTWSLLWYPEVEVLPLVPTHLVVVKAGEALRLHKNGALAGEISIAAISNTGNKGSNVLIGANRAASGDPERFFEGKLGLEFYRGAASVEMVEALYQGAGIGIDIGL